jgi:SAM-dependent methyltransferase
MMLGLREPFDYDVCTVCGALQIARIPSDLERFYDEGWDARARPARRGGARGPHPLRRAWTRARLRPGRLARWISGRRYGRFDWFRRTRTGLGDPILDVGCGRGRLLDRLVAEGFEDLTGIDPRLPSARPSDAPPRLLRVALEDHRGRYHLVMAHHSFEHCPDPAAAFAAFARLVEPGGHLLLRTPVAEGWACAHYGADWVQLDAPRHLHVPTRRSIERLAAAHGFRLLRVDDDSGPFQIWGSELYRRDVPLVEGGRGGRRALGAALRLRARWRARGLRRRGLGDQRCFYLRRVDGAAT